MLLVRLVWPVGLLFAGTLAILCATFVWASRSLDETAFDRQRQRIVRIVDNRLAGIGDALAEAVGSDGVDHAVGAGAGNRSEFMASMSRRHGLDRLSLFDEQLHLLATDSQPMTGDAANRLLSLLDILADAPSSTRLVSDDGLLFAAIVVRTGAAAASGGRLVGLKRLDVPTDLAAAFRFAGIEDLHFVASPRDPASASVPVQNLAGQAGGELVWSPDLPGGAFRSRVVPIGLAGLMSVAALMAIVLLYLRRVTRAMDDNHARSQALVGLDPLSGLANRLLFSQRLDAALAALTSEAGGLAVLFIDLDRFKDVNDTYGHQAGDDLIQLVAQRLVGVIRSSDTLARFGGDEFAIIQMGVRSIADTECLSRRILDALTSPFAIAHTQVTVGASIGIAMAPENAVGREGLMGLADTALYQAKSEGRNRFSFFQLRMDETIRMRKTVEDDLRLAIENDGLLLNYQPLFSADGENIVGLEALVRWPHPTRGLINPTEFIGIAEERGLIIPLGEWVLRRACTDCRRWPGLRMAVNVSPIQFRHRSFVDTVMNILDETGFDPGLLELELTEGVVVEDADAAEAAMMELRALGVHLALDDFGTGYSSLIYLRRFAFDKIKIDRSFLESMEATGESAILVHSIVHLGRALGLTVTAEGVETREQHRFLQALGCHQLQGFLFSKPVARDEIDSLLGMDDAQAA